jgi:uncharacterized protein
MDPLVKYSRRRFDSHLALAELPWFDVREGRLVLADRSIGPVADVHAHLALTFLRRQSVDLRAAHEDAELYLPVSHAVDLQVYANRNFDADDLTALERDLAWRATTKGGMRRTHTVPNLVRHMEEMGVTSSILLPIELPLMSWNSETWLEAARGEGRLINLGSVHPFGRAVRERLERLKKAGIRGIKLHPAVQMFPPDHPRAMEVYRACADLDLPVLWHCGPVDIETRIGRWCSQLKHYWRAVHDHPDTRFVLGHSGALQFDLALQLAQRYRNVWLELSSQGLPNVRRLVLEAPEDRVLFGSDWPFYHQSMPLAKTLIATDDRREQRGRILWDNAAALFGLG